MIDDYQTKALLIAIGGDSAPAVACINHFSPELLCFFLTEPEKETIESQVQPQIARMPQRWDWILTPDPESFAQSHLAITKGLPDILKTWGVQPGELVVDFSAATPAMAGAVAFACAPFSSKVVQLIKADSSVSESKTVVVGGDPRTWEESNPWNEGAAYARREASLLFNQGAYSSAAKKFRQIEGLVSGSLKPLYHALVELAEGYALWEAFHYREAWDKLKTSLKALELASVWGGPPGLSSVLSTVKTNATFLEGIVLDPHDVKFSMALDLLAHAKRRAERDHQIELATLTLLRGLEAFAQHQLVKQFNVKTWDVQPDQLPKDLQESCRNSMLDDVDGKYKLPLPAQFRALAGFGDPMGQTFDTEWPKMKTLLDSVYQSVLGHGFHTTKSERFQQLHALVLKLTKVEENSLPRFPSMTL
jgi:CRISPR-associated protein (TIGR02710 family)